MVSFSLCVICCSSVSVLHHVKVCSFSLFVLPGVQGVSDADAALLPVKQALESFNSRAEDVHTTSMCSDTTRRIKKEALHKALHNPDDLHSVIITEMDTTTLRYLGHKVGNTLSYIGCVVLFF